MSECEKIICTDGGCGANALSPVLSALLAGQKQCDPTAMAAMINNNNWNNSPWMYLIFLALFGGGNGFGWGGNRSAEMENANSRAIASLSNQMSDNHNSDLVLQAINGNRDAMGQLAQTFNVDFGQIQQAVCGMKSAIEQVGGAVGYSAEGVKNAIALGDSNIIQQMQSCCCQQKELAIRGNYENQLATERQTNVLGGQMAANHAADQLQDCQNHSATMSRIDQLANGIQQGFASIGFNQQQNTQAIINNATANTQRILDQMCANTTQGLRDTIAEKDRQLQTASIIAGLKANGCGC